MFRKNLVLSVAAALAAYAQGALALHAGRTPIEKLESAMLKGPALLSNTGSGGAKIWAGRTPLNSGTASVTVSTAMVHSDSIIHGTWIPNATVASGQQWTTPAPMSIVHGVSFAVANVDGQGRAPGGVFCWEIRRST